MTTKRTYRTRTGQVLTDSDIALTAAEMETTEYDIDELKTRRRPPSPINPELVKKGGT